MKKYLSTEDIEFLEKEMELDELEQKSIPAKREQANDNELAPSVFSNNFERFDYLKTKENLSEEETAWIAWYKTTDEFKELYN